VRFLPVIASHSIATVSYSITPSICSPFVFILLRIAFPASPLFSQSSALLGGVGVTLSTFRALLVGISWQSLSFHTVANSLSLRKKSTPLQSTKSKLFCKNTGGGGARARGCALVGSVSSWSQPRTLGSLAIQFAHRPACSTLFVRTRRKLRSSPYSHG
jgi:hypothetical protein